VRAFLDTSVLVATFYGEHQHHLPSIELFLRQDNKCGFCAAHTLAEVYSVLTGMPGKDRASVDEALLFLVNVRERLKIIALDGEEYITAIEACSALGIIGGGIHDAIVGQCALKARAEVIYTWNIKHFNRLGPLIAGRVRTP